MKKTPYRAHPSKGGRIHETAAAPATPVAPGPAGFAEVAEIRAGFPYAQFLELQEALGVPATMLGETIGIPSRTLQRRREEGRLSKEESDRLDRVRKLHRQAVGTLGSIDAARTWLRRPHVALAGFAPLDLADTGPGALEVERLLGRLDYGVYA